MVSRKPVEVMRIVCGTATAVLLVFASVVCFAGDSGSAVVDTMDKAKIDWSAGYYYATGDGAMPSDQEEPNRAKAYLKAKSYAKMAAIANLFTAVEGTSISYYAVGKDYMVVDTLLRQRIEGYLSNVEAIDEKRESVGGDTVVSVTVRCPIYGGNGPGGAILRSKPPPAPATPVTIDNKITPAPSSDVSATGPYTSLIVDCTGLDIQRALAPKLRLPSGEEAFGALSFNTGTLVEQGFAAYAATLEQARGLARAGSTPLVVKAIGRAGGVAKCDAVISDADAGKVKAEDATARFLENCNVIFVVGAGSKQ
jgi:hypothetical protein